MWSCGIAIQERYEIVADNRPPVAWMGDARFPRLRKRLRRRLGRAGRAAGRCWGSEIQSHHHTVVGLTVRVDNFVCGLGNLEPVPALLEPDRAPSTA